MTVMRDGGENTQYHLRCWRRVTLLLHPATVAHLLLLLLHCCYTVVTLFVTLLLHCCYTVAHTLLQCCYTVVTLLLHPLLQLLRRMRRWSVRSHAKYVIA
jgi:hypothetical protein